MAKHKAPTQVSIASTEEETTLSTMVKSYGKPVMGVAIVVSAVVLFREWSATNESLKVTQGWEELGREVAFEGTGFFSQGISNVSTLGMENFATANPKSPAGAWAKALEIGQHLRDDNAEAADRALEELQKGWPDHILNTQALFSPPADSDGSAKKLAAHIGDQTSALKQWMMDNNSIFEAQPMPADAPKVRFNTSAGSFVIGLRSALAPQHCSNFIRLCSEGFYDNMTFHEVDQGKYIKSGSAASRDANKSEEWGSDDNGSSIKPEIGQLWNYQFSVGAASSVDFPSESSDCRFYIVSGSDAHERDRNFTVFGTVIEGTETITAIDTGKLLGNTPVEPIVIQSTEVL